MGNDIKRHVQSCDTCQKRQKPVQTEPLHPIKVGRPFDRLGISVPHESNRIELSQIRIRFDRITNRI